ncbi:host nuclease inhibitor protein [Pseudomonas leptonychotis]|uniref:host nuclease inhibitor protein n=1 Tax=Pseudomonas leptonychotis TaxID=2448482 RepID=UPI00386D5F05
MSINIAMLMEQASVWASAWSLVGGRFDQGDQLQVANEEKDRLEDMLNLFEEQTDANAANGNLREIADGLIQWHQNKLENFDTILNAPKDTEIRIGSGGDPLILSGEQLKGVRMGLIIAREWIEKFPLSITPSEPSDEEE